MDASQVKDLVLQLLPMLAPLAMEALKAIMPNIMDRIPWYLKPVVNAVFAALLGLLSDLGAGGGAAIGAASSVGYVMARNKEPK